MVSQRLGNILSLSLGYFNFIAARHYIAPSPCFPSVYIGDDTPEEPDFSYIPDTVQLTNKLPPGTDPLTGSMILLEQALKSDVALNEFEVSKQW